MKGESAIEANLTDPTTNLVGWVKQTNLLNLYPLVWADLKSTTSHAVDRLRGPTKR